QSDGSRRRRSGTQRLEAILIDRVRQAGEGDDAPASRFAQPGAEHRPESVLLDQSPIKPAAIDQQSGLPIVVEMQARLRCAPRQRSADIKEVAVALGARAQHRIAERDGVAFSPGDALAERWALARLVGRAGPGR